MGRNAAVVDCFVDSAIHTRLISRQHAEISIETDKNNALCISVLDKSLNGTFVNDVKVKMRCYKVWGSAHLSLTEQVFTLCTDYIRQMHQCLFLFVCVCVCVCVCACVLACVHGGGGGVKMEEMKYKVLSYLIHTFWYALPVLFSDL